MKFTFETDSATVALQIAQLFMGIPINQPASAPPTSQPAPAPSPAPSAPAVMMPPPASPAPMSTPQPTAPAPLPTPMQAPAPLPSPVSMPAPAPSPMPAPAAAPSPAPAAGGAVTAEMLQQKVGEWVSRPGNSAQAMQGWLQQNFGVARVRDLKPEQYASVYQALA